MATQAPVASTVGRRPLRWLLAVVTIGVLAWFGYIGAQKFGPLGEAAAAASEIRLVTVTARDASQPMPVLTATGKIVADHKVLVNTKVSGQIVELRFEQGDRVREGQALARIEDVIYEAQRDQAAAQLEQAQASLRYQEINFRRIEKLRETDAAPEIEYAEARRDYEEAQARVAAAEAALRWAQKALTDCEVLAPIAGVILERNVEVGDFVAAEGGRGAIANAQLCTIADMTRLRVEVDISELDIARIRQGLACTVIPDAYKDRRYQGRVMWLDPGANYSKATVQVKVRIENPDEFLRVEGSAQVSFLVDDTKGDASSAGTGIWIPTSACQRDGSGNGGRAFVAEGGRLRATQLTLGRQVGNQIEVLSGLAPGQSIVADGLDKLSDGQRLRS